MPQVLEQSVKSIVLSNSPFGPHEVSQIMQAIGVDFTNYRQLNEAVQELETKGDHSPAGKVRLGVCYYLMGKYSRAVETLQGADGGAMAQFYMAKSYFALLQYDQAVDHFKAAATAGYDAVTCNLARVEALRYAGKPEESLKLLESLTGPVEQTAEYLYQRAATLSSLGGDPIEVVSLFERAVALDPKHPGALFGLGMENDRRGNDDMALDLYQRAALRFPSHYGALLNLGILYEDRQMFERARSCYSRILEMYPGDGRARMYLKDTMASGDMFYDEDAQRRRDKLSQVLNIPVTDFELSVRSRNCLQKMGLHTLGDLTRVTEAELLASKNFGETSLTEIKEMMTSRGLSLGQFAHERAPSEVIFEPVTMSADEQAVLTKSIADLNLSVRARKCMMRLGIQSIGELLRKTGDELLECKNFGVTSLNEVREKLTTHGLKLRGD